MIEPIIVIGGGIAGLSCAWAIAQKGHQVFVFEQNKIGNEASSRAAGMLTPSFEALFGEETFLKLFLESLSHYKNFVNKVEKI